MRTRKSIAVWVSNDLTFDQRVKKTCETLDALGWTPVLVGREMPDSKPWQGPWEAHRLRLSAQHGPLFYASLQLQLHAWLRRNEREIDAIWCNDLDTLAPALWRNTLPVVYDSHEYFTEAAGLTGRPIRRAIWLGIERWAMRKLSCMITVNESIASAYRSKYGLDVAVVRNMPRRQPPVAVEGREAFVAHGVPIDLPIALMQGAYMDRDRGVAQAVAALPEMKGVRLVLVGAGLEWNEARAMVNAPEMEGRLHCIPKLPFNQLRILTASADVGLSLDQAGHGNYEMSLPNKLFDFMHARLPMVVTARKEVAAIVEECSLGEVIEKASPSAIKSAVGRVLSKPKSDWKEALSLASERFHWGVDEPQIKRILEQSLKAHLTGSQTT